MTLENLPVPEFSGKADMYAWLARQAEYFVDGLSKKFTPQANLVLGLANVAALCFYELNRLANATASLQELPVNWFGFYLVQASGVLALGPFQGRPACTEIRFGRGVCGRVAESRQALVVKDVHEFPGHIACDSTSASEVVVPILAANGGIFGLIDVDSTQLGHFDEDDKNGLEAIASILSKHLVFPIARALAANPSLDDPNFSVAKVGFFSSREVKTEAALGSSVPAEAAVAHSEAASKQAKGGKPIPFFTIDVKPVKTCKQVGDWDFTTTRLDRISGQTSLQSLEKETGVSAFPEIQFPCNTFSATFTGTGDAPLIFFDLVSILKNASAFYTSSYYRETVQSQMMLPVSEGWALAPFDRHDPGVDWGWRHRYYGILPEKLKPLEPDMKGINWDLLRDSSLPIVFFDEIDFFEDDLHDFGVVRCSVKFRVMTTAFFILFRHFVRLDRHMIWMRDIRIFHKFGETRTEGGVDVPHIVVVEQFAKHDITEHDSLQWKDVSPDEVFKKATLLSEHIFCVDTTAL